MNEEALEEESLKQTKTLLLKWKNDKNIQNTPKLRKKNRVKSITGTLQIEGNSFTEEKVTSVINGARV